VTNTGDGKAAVTGLSIIEGASDFAQSNDCGELIAAGGGCRITVAFTPSTRNSRSGQLALTTADQVLDVSMTGNGMQVAGNLDAVTTTDFGSGFVKETSTSLRFTYTNTGTTAIPGIYASLEGAGLAFQTRGNLCGTVSAPREIAAGTSCSMTVIYSRPTAGTLSGALLLNSPSQGAPKRLDLTGVAVMPESSVNATSFYFGPVLRGTNAVKYVTLTNHTSAALAMTPPVLEAPTWFTMTTNCGTSLAANGSCMMAVKYAPNEGVNRLSTGVVKVSTGSRTYSLNVDGSETDYSYDISAGSTFEAPMGQSSPTKVYTFTANPAADISVSISSDNLEEFPFTTTCGTTLQAGKSCTISLRFTPTASGKHFANFYAHFGQNAGTMVLQGTVK